MKTKHERYQQLIDRCGKLPPAPTAVAHPCDQSSLEGAVGAAKQGLIAPILVVPDLEAGNILAKSLTFLAGADVAGIVLGARVPIILTSRADTVIARLASSAVAALVANARRENGTKSIG